MTELLPFSFDGTPVRVLTDSAGEPWFVLADLCTILGIGNVTMTADRLADDEVRRATFSLAEGSRDVTRERPIVSEPGMWRVILRSDSPASEPVRRWVTHDVLPAIRRTGVYSTASAAPLSGPRLLAAAVIEAQAMIAAHESVIAELTPRAEAFDAFLSTTGDCSVNEAAKILSRHHDILTGEKRLRSWMVAHGWIYREQSTNAPRAYQKRVDAGHLTERAQFHYHPETGEKVIDTPQVRVTARGIEALARALTKTTDQGELDVDPGDAA